MIETESEFEDEVRRIARLLWPSAEYSGSAMVGNRERDGVFETDDAIHLVECTVSRKKLKAEQDGDKIAKLIQSLSTSHRDKVIKGWFITKDEPTADQRTAIADIKMKIVSLSFDQFRSKLVDARSYLTMREKYAFGSVRDPETGDTNHKLDYVALDILDQAQEQISLETIAKSLSIGDRIVLLGDYGAGKSTTLREIYHQLSRFFWQNDTIVFPILINLRDHHGQVDPTEAIERHARKIGFANPSHLVRAWRASYAILMLDGFDEIATAGWSERSKSLRDLRYRSMELVRRFIKETPYNNAIIVSGRLHFFNSERELRSALDIDARFATMRLSDFTVSQVTEYLTKRGWDKPIPAWLPTRPLLLGYLASRDLLRQVCEIDIGSSPAAGWNALLDRIAPREAEIEAGIDASTVRRLLERLSTRARASSDGLGPISTEQIRAVFTDVCGYSPDERALVLLQRLPGLGVYRADDDSRSFIDKDLAHSAQAGDVFKFIENPFDDSEYTRLDAGAWQCSLGPIGVEVLSLRCHEVSYSPGKLASAAVCAMKAASGDTLCSDIVLVIRELNFDYRDKPLYINNVLIPKFSVDPMIGDLKNITFQECFFEGFEFDGEVDPKSLPKFRRCYFAKIEGRTSASDLPNSAFDETCVIEEFDNATTTTNSILQLEIPLGAKVLLTILRKLYIQRGSGRRELAFSRGLDHQAQRLVPEILDLIRRHGFAQRTKQGDNVIWVPIHSAEIKIRAHAIISAPNSVNDLLLRESAMLE